MSQDLRVELACAGCRATLRIDERASTRTGRLVYTCKPCGRSYSLERETHALHDETVIADTASGTLRMRPVAQGAAPPAAPRGDEMKLPVGLSVSLEIIDGPGRGRTFHIDRRLAVIGREHGEVRLADPMSSRRHATLEVHDIDTIILRDLSSTNGTYHNDQLIAFCRISDGDEIRIGSTTMTVSVDLLG